MPTILLNNIRPGGNLLKNLKVGSTEVKYVKRGDGKFFYDTLKDTTYSDITISSFSYSTNTVAASGGSTSTPSYAYSQLATPVGYAGNYTASSKTSGATVSFSKVSGDGASVNTSTGVVTWDSRGTSYSASTREAVVRITVSLNGKSKTKDCTVYLSKNVITSMTYSASSGGALNNPATYAASANSKDVTNKTAASATVLLTFSSGSKSTSYSTYGTLTTTYSWSSNQTYATLTSANSSGLSVTMTSRGATYAAGTRAATITRTASFSFSLSSTYNNANLRAVTTSKTATATVTQEANTFSKVSIGVNAGAITAPGNYGAGASALTVSSNKAASLGTVTLTFKSGSTTTSYSTYGSISGPVYSWSSNQTYATLTSSNAASLSVTMTSRGTTYASGTRTAVITRTAKYTYTLSSSYTGFSATSKQASCTATITQNKNVFKSASVVVNAGTLTAPGTYGAGSSAQSVANKTAASLASVTLTFDSNSTTTSYSTYGSVSGPVYSWSSNLTYATLTSSNATSLSVTMTSRSNSYSASTRSATITRKAEYTFTLSSSYTGISATKGSANATATVTQAKNVITSISLTVSGGALTAPGTYKASAHTLSVANKTSASGSVVLTYSSGGTRTTTNNTYGTFSGPTYSWSSNQTYATLTSSNAASLNVTMTTRGTTYDASTRSAVITRSASMSYELSSSYNNAGVAKSTKSASCTATITQGANKITSVYSVSVSAGAITYNSGSTVGAGGLTATTGNITNATASATLQLASGSTIAANTTYGTLTGPTYSWSETDSAGMISFTSANNPTLSVTTASRGTSYSTSTRSATLTRTASFKYTVKADYTTSGSAVDKTNNASCSTTIKQAANTITISSVTVNKGALTNPAQYGAGESTKSVANKTAATASGVLKFSSGSEVVANSTYGSWSGPTYSWTSNQTYATLTSSNAASLNVKMASRGKTYSSTTRSATITRTASFTYTLSSTYGGASKSNSAGATATVTLAANTITISVSVSGGSLTNPATYGAGANTKSVANKTAATASGTLNWASGSTNAADTTYGSWSGPTYSWSSNQTYATLTSSNAASLNVTMTSRGATYSTGTRTATITRTATFKYTLNSANGGGSKSNTGNATATVTQAKNAKSTVYNTPTISSATSSDIPASGGTFAASYLTVKYSQTAYYSYDSGSNTSANPHSVASGAAASTTMLTFSGTAPSGSNLATTVTARTKKGSVTVYVTANGKKSAGKSVNVYQQANLGTTITTEIKPTLSYAGMSSETGLTSTPTVGYTWKYYISYTSGKDTDVSTVNSPNGPGISAMSPKYILSATTYFSINSSTGVVTTKSANTSTTADRTAVVTLELTFGGKTGQTTATVIQSKKASYYNLAWKFSVFNVTNSIYSFGFKFTNSAGNLLTVSGGGGSGGTSNPSRVGTSSIRSDISTSVFRPNGFYFTNMSSRYSSANNSSGYYLDGSTGKYYYVRWAYNKAPTTSNYKTHGYKFYSGIVESWTYSAGTLYVWVYQS